MNQTKPADDVSNVGHAARPPRARKSVADAKARGKAQIARTRLERVKSKPKAKPVSTPAPAPNSDEADKSLAEAAKLYAAVLDDDGVAVKNNRETLNDVRSKLWAQPLAALYGTARALGTWDAVDAFTRQQNVSRDPRTFALSHALVRLAVPRDLWRSKRSTIANHAEVLDAAFEHNVEDFNDWLFEPERVGRKEVVGLKKGTAMFRALPRVKEEREERRHREVEHANDAISEYIARHTEDPDAVINAATLRASVKHDSLYLATVSLDGDGDPVVLQITPAMQTFDDKRRLVTKLMKLGFLRHEEFDEEPSPKVSKPRRRL